MEDSDEPHNDATDFYLYPMYNGEFVFENDVYNEAIPKGVIEDGEDIKEAANREAEFYGFEISGEPILFFVEYSKYSYGTKHYICKVKQLDNKHSRNNFDFFTPHEFLTDILPNEELYGDFDRTKVGQALRTYLNNPE